ncbi:hypothetical protein [Mucilaginibacter gynuensis]
MTGIAFKTKKTGLQWPGFKYNASLFYIVVVSLRNTPNTIEIMAITSNT